MKWVRLILSILVTALGVVAGLIQILSFFLGEKVVRAWLLSQIDDSASREGGGRLGGMAELMLEPHFLFGLALVGVAVVLKMNLSRIVAPKAGGISWLRFARILNPYIYWKVLFEIHSFHHMFRRYANRAYPLKRWTDSHQDALEKLLKRVKVVADWITGADVAVNIKVFTTEVGESVSVRDADLVTIVRIGSERERRLAKRGEKLFPRCNDEVFRIIVGDEGAPGRMGNVYLGNPSIFDPFRVNSAYNYCFGRTRHFWVNNDLPEASESGEYFSTSNSYESYYRALAVFLLSDPLEPGSSPKANSSSPMGILVVDSWKKHRFDERVFCTVMGYFAHRLFQFISATSE